MKKYHVFALLVSLLHATLSFAQETTLASNFKHIRLSAPGNGAYSKALILLHPIYNGADLANNYIVGHLTARRGGINATNRLNTVFINSSSAYRSVAAMVSSYDHTAVAWRLKTCYYNGVKYIALDVPYLAQHHAQGLLFAGWIASSGEYLKFLIYDVNGVPQNTSVLTDIQDYVANMNSTQQVKNFNVLGKVGIGTTDPKEELSVNGYIRAKEIKVEATNWPDYVLQKDYDLSPLSEVEGYINEHGHLPEIPKASEVETEGVSLGEMNKLLLKKVEELTLHLIEKEKEIRAMQTTANRMAELERKLEKFERILEAAEQE